MIVFGIVAIEETYRSQLLLTDVTDDELAHCCVMHAIVVILGQALSVSLPLFSHHPLDGR